MDDQNERDRVEVNLNQLKSGQQYQGVAAFEVQKRSIGWLLGV